jgi:hypothetical protein
MTDVTYVVTGKENRHFGLPSDDAIYQWGEIEKYIHTQWKISDHHGRNILMKYRGCLDKMGNMLLQAKRIQEFHTELVSFARANSGEVNSFGAMAGHDAISDFEALLFQCRATLDRYSYLISNLLDDRNSSYRKLSNVLKNSGNK